MTEIIVAGVGALLLLILVVRAVLRVPLLDQVRARVDLREQVITFPATRMKAEGCG